MSTHSHRPLRSRVAAYLDAFNRMDLDAVMDYFSPDAEYEPGDGTQHRGLAAIRKAFLPQFSYAWGKMYFEEEDFIIDAPVRKVVLRWICRIDAREARFHSLPVSVKLFLARMRYGDQASWKGLDILHLDQHGSIERKYTYANYQKLKLRKDIRPLTQLEHRIEEKWSE